MTFRTVDIDAGHTALDTDVTAPARHVRSRRRALALAHRFEAKEEWTRKGRRFLRYLATRKMECWGFFAAGFLIATIF